MISREVLAVATRLTEGYAVITEHESWEQLPELFGVFAGLTEMTRRDMVSYLLEAEEDWPWKKKKRRKRYAKS